ncbi:MULTISPECIES: hypothetical protein [Desulfovibrio]|uniref:hypothetical protein n=1 Tax=Desulfovibrio TaxID=872 RepID=UPI001160A770|nr:MULTISPECIES: hypothetical protein [Desulfovibrio]
MTSPTDLLRHADSQRYGKAESITPITMISWRKKAMALLSGWLEGNNDNETPKTLRIISPGEFPHSLQNVECRQRGISDFYFGLVVADLRHLRELNDV